ncbi:hypothetical protein LWI28_019185 [Acer negundo]|uniref:Reverse transcriptase zinc-binding domain-containing protein n=1 Tax=Acer negundo TaxID=4023 RepID=A0AAD5NV26_ACENE|nr:hypothetical protein LWI28_019185 [Acer negundo]
MGSYTVKSGYKVGCSLLSDPGLSGEGGGSSSLRTFWKGLWKLSLPAKVKLFVWRACNNFLPTNECLSRRKMHVDPRCPLCKCKNESILHALWVCRLLKVDCLLWPSVNGRCSGGAVYFLEFILDCFHHLNYENMGLLCVVLWRNWYIRNVRVHGSKCDAGINNLEWAHHFLRDYSAASVVSVDAGQSVVQSKI